MKVDCTVEINNYQETDGKYVVARVVNGELWYWGTYNRDSDAEAAVKEIYPAVVVKKIIPENDY